jgi:macrolide transport system ATP-binding/permease protein
MSSSRLRTGTLDFCLRALLLAAIGLYGVTTNTAVRRTPEIRTGIALEVVRTRMIGKIMRGAMFQAVAGLAIGIPIAIFYLSWDKLQLLRSSA